MDTKPGKGNAAPGKGNAARLKHYWTRGKGRAKWVGSAHPWTALYRHLRKYMNDNMAKRTASQWYHDTLGHWVGEKRGKNKLGPG